MKKEKTFDNSNTTANSTQLEILKKNFPQCFDKNGDFIPHKMQEIITKEGINLSKESYSLNWLGKSYARLLANETPLTLLKEDKKHNQKSQNKNSENLLIKGDNLEVLKHLRHAYSEQVKMIYIDPPYNTGNDDFVYNDDRKFTPEQLQRLAGIDEDEAKRILDFTNSKSNSHSAWLTFIYPRLYVARELLSDDGVIFISIDDNEVAQLRLLMDEVFGEDNFRGELIRATGTTTGQTANKLGSSYDTMLCYAKTDFFDFTGINLEGKDLNRFNNNDNDGKGKYALLQLRKTGNADRKEDREGMFFPIVSPDETEVYPIGPTNYLSRWRVGKKTYESMLKDDLIVWKKEDSNDIKEILVNGKKYRTIWKPYVKYYLEKRTKKASNLWTDIDGNKKGSIEIKALFGFSAFSNPKPIEFLHSIIEISDIIDKDLILDFFAGSGTTADAVMQLNAEDGGNRKCISVQLDEAIDPKQNKTAYDFVKDELKQENPTIFDITKERIIRAAKKIKEEHKDKDLSKQDFGFRVFETVPMFTGYFDEMDELDEQTVLFNNLQLSSDDLQMLLTTWMVNDGIKLTCPVEKITLDKYTTYYADKNLYLMDKGFTTDDLKALIEKLDSVDGENKNFQPTKLILFGYNFESKHQREISEALDSYTNKKKIELYRVIRY